MYLSVCSIVHIKLILKYIIMLRITNQRKFRTLFGKNVGINQCKASNTDRGIDSSSLLLTRPAYVKGVNVKWLLTSHFGH